MTKIDALDDIYPVISIDEKMRYKNLPIKAKRLYKLTWQLGLTE